MAELSYVLKCFIATLIIILCLQIKVGGKTIETHSLNWFYHSKISSYVHNVAAGGALAGRDLYQASRRILTDLLNGSHARKQQAEQVTVEASK